MTFSLFSTFSYKKCQKRHRKVFSVSLMNFVTISLTMTIMSKKTQHFSGRPATINLVRPNHPPSHRHVKTLVIGLFLSALGAGCFVLQTIIPTVAVSHMRK